MKVHYRYNWKEGRWRVTGLYHRDLRAAKRAVRFIGNGKMAIITGVLTPNRWLNALAAQNAGMLNGPLSGRCGESLL